MRKKIAVIGAASFSGRHLIHQALSQGFKVLGLSYAAKTSIPFTPYHWKMGGTHHLALEQLDLKDQSEKASSIIHDYQPDYIIDCSDQGPLERFSQLKIRIPIQKYVYVTTTKENQYGRCKIDEAFSLENFCFLNIDPNAHIYGPGQPVEELIPHLVLSLLLKKKLSFHHKEESCRSFIHINDVAIGILKVACEGVPGEAYHLTNDRLISMADLVTLICNRMSVPLEEVETMIEDCPGQGANSFSKSITSCRNLGWKPTIQLEEGIDSVIDWAQEWLPALKNHLNDF